MSVLAAIDIGTNSTRIMVRDDDRLVTRRTRVTRLGAETDRSGRLSESGIARTLDVLRDYADLMAAHGVERFRAVATSAARDAANRSDFFEPARAVLGTEPELLSGQLEGELAYLGATSGLDHGGASVLVVDVGGGSTEFSIGRGTAFERAYSADVGAVRLTERFLAGDPPTAAELSNAVGHVYDHIDDVVRELPGVHDIALCVGVAGTITTMAAVEIGLQDYDPERIHHFRLTKVAAEDVFRTLATERLADRVHNPGLPRDRADIIVGGCCVVVGILRRLGLAEILVSERDILDGLVLSLAG